MVSCSLPFSKEKDKSIFAVFVFSVFSVFKQKSSSAVTENRAIYIALLEKTHALHH
jgi:hypothetical protein